MSSRSTIFLTKDNEHWYEETDNANYDDKGIFLGFTLELEFDSLNSHIEYECCDGFTVRVTPGTELYDKIKSMRDHDKIYKRLKVLKQKLSEFRVKIYSGQSLEDNEKDCLELEQLVSNLNQIF